MTLLLRSGQTRRPVKPAGCGAGVTHVTMEGSVDFLPVPPLGHALDFCPSGGSGDLRFGSVLSRFRQIKPGPGTLPGRLHALF